MHNAAEKQILEYIINELASFRSTTRCIVFIVQLKTKNLNFLN